VTQETRQEFDARCAPIQAGGCAIRQIQRGLAPTLASYDGAAELDRFLDLLLPGMTATLTGRDREPATI
jgi:hypothetical protein